MTPILERTTFKTSRLLEFCSEKELTNQLGHERDKWPPVILKELLDNALDACEETDIAPDIKVKVDASGITVADNGLGIPAKTIVGIIDYRIRVSSKEAYVAPDRGAQGNALKTLVAMPFVLGEDDEPGQVDITTEEGRHEIVFCMDPIRQEPKITRTVKIDDNVKNGTVFTIYWPKSASDILTSAKDQFLQLASDFTFLNPHLSLTLDWFGQVTKVKATAPNWKKWKPHDPTSPHWYSLEDFERLLAAYISYDQDRGTDRYVRDVVKEFRGLSGSSKQKSVLNISGMQRTRLSSLAGDDVVDHVAAARLLAAMKENSKGVRPSALGIIGKEHLRQRFQESGADEETFHYKKLTDIDTGVPAVVETAFALLKDKTERRRIISGVNWSGAIGNPFRNLGASYHDGLNALLEKQMAGSTEPVMFLLHCARARLQFKDRGKTQIAIS